MGNRVVINPGSLKGFGSPQESQTFVGLKEEADNNKLLRPVERLTFANTIMGGIDLPLNPNPANENGRTTIDSVAGNSVNVCNDVHINNFENKRIQMTH